LTFNNIPDKITTIQVPYKRYAKRRFKLLSIIRHEHNHLKNDRRAVMKKKLFLLGMFGMVLTFGIVVIGCDNGSGGGGGGGGAPSLDGTWSKSDDSAIRFNGGNLQSTGNITATNVNWTLEGTYQYSSPTLTVTPPPSGGVVQSALVGTAVINGIQLTISGFTGTAAGLNGSWTKQ
jgi:hypothetical protein